MAAPVLESFEMAVALADLSDWLIQQGLSNTPVDTWLETFCHKTNEAGIPLTRVNITLRAYHPEIGSVAFRWNRDIGNERFDYARRNDAPDDFRQSPIYHLVTNNMKELRQRLHAPNPEFDFPIFSELRERGATDYFVTKRFFLRGDHEGPIDEKLSEEGVVISFAGDEPGGFSDPQLDGLRSLISPLCLTLKSGANRTMAEDISAAYIGKDASRRVLSGDIRRGTSETISAVICYFDLQGFTKLSETLEGTAIIELLNAYFAEAVEIIEERGGNVLKFMGDGILAIFDLKTVPDAGQIACNAAVALRQAFVTLNAQRSSEGLPITGFKLALHAGDVLYGNIGSKTRLDFTVIGPAVNTTARILDMSSAVGQTIVISETVAHAVKAERPDLVSLGQYRMRGVASRLELFTLD